MNSQCEMQLKDADAEGLAAVAAEQCGASIRRMPGSSSAYMYGVGCVEKSVFESTVVESINSLRQEVGEL